MISGLGWSFRGLPSATPRGPFRKSGTEGSNPLCSSGESGANSTPRLRRPASCEPRAWPFHFWRSLVEKAGYKLSDIPNTWDAFLDFFMPVQDKLRAQGMLFRIGQCKIQIPLSSI